MNPVQFCLQPDNTFVVQNLGNDKIDPSDDANVVQICDNVISLHTAEVASQRSCTTVRLELAPEPIGIPTGCPSSTIPIPTDVLFRVRSRQFGTWFLGPETEGPAQLTSDLNAATQFSASEISSARILYGATVTQRFEAYFKSFYGQNSGSFDFGPSGQAAPPILFCLQPDNTFAVYSDGADGPQRDKPEPDPNGNVDGSADPTTVVTCPADDGSGRFAFIDNGVYMNNQPDGPCYPDTLVYEPVVAPTPGACVPLPTDVHFRIRSFAQQTVSGEQVWLLANIDVQGTMATTSDINQATRFQPADDGTDQIYTFRDNEFYYSAFVPFFNEDSGYIRMYPDQFVRFAVTFCLKSDNSLGVYSAGEDGPTDADPRFVLTCPNREQPVFLDNGSYAASPGEPACKRDTLFYEALPPLTIPDQQT